MHGPQGMLGGQVKVPGVAEEAGEVGGEELDQASAGVGVAVLGRAEQRLECVVLGQPIAPSLEQLTMAIEQLDAGEPQGQAPRSFELLLRQHRGAPQVLPQSAFAASNTVFSDGTVRSSSTGENGTGTSIAPIRFTGASRW